MRATRLIVALALAGTILSGSAHAAHDPIEIDQTIVFQNGRFTVTGMPCRQGIMRGPAVESGQFLIDCTDPGRSFWVGFEQGADGSEFADTGWFTLDELTVPVPTGAGRYARSFGPFTLRLRGIWIDPKPSIGA